MKSNYPVIVLLFVLSGLNSFSQTNVKWEKQNFPGRESEYSKAFKAYDEGNKLFYYVGPPAYEGALVQYLEAYAFNPNNDELNFHIGHVLQFLIY